LDYFLARYYSSGQGRFTSADLSLVGQYETDPQSWNLYAYCRNNPLLYVDPTGHDYIVYDKDGNEKRIKDKDLGDYALVSSGGGGYTAVFRDKNGKEWSGSFVNAPTGDEVNVQAPGAVIMGHVMGEYLGDYGKWIRENSRADGMVIDPTQSRLGQWLNPTYIDPNDFTIVDYWIYRKERELEMLTPAVGGTSAARKSAAKLGSELVKKFKVSGVGKAVGRSGGQGEAFKKAGAELIRRANHVADKEIKEAMKIEGQRLIDKGKGISHK
jgi:hypothetical protein